MSNGSKPNRPKATKRDLQRSRAEERRAAQRKAQQRRMIAYLLGATAIVAVVAVVVLSMSGGDGSGPSDAGDVTVEGAPRDAPLAAGDAVPSFTAPELAGGTVDWSTYAGKPAVISVWAPWCPHCQVELPILSGVMDTYPDVGFVTITTSIDAQPGPTPEEYMADEGLSFPVAVDDAQGTLASAFGIQGFPTLYFVNSDGTVAGELEGEIDEATLRQTIDSLQ